MNAKTIDRYISLSVTDCKRLGYLRPASVCVVVVRWTQGGDEVAAVHLRTDTVAAEPSAVLRYTYRGTTVEVPVALRFKASNLKPNTGYYYFVCPDTGQPCRKLYLVEGKFVSRAAFRPLYEQQTLSRQARQDGNAWLFGYAKLENLLAEKYRRYTYRGKLTPYGRRCEKLNARVEGIFGGLMHVAETQGWSRV